MSTQKAPVTITESAAERLRFLIGKDGNPDLAFRISVSGGGCSGFQYGFDFKDKPEPGDIESEQHGVKVLIDGMAMLYILGAEVDYVEDLIGASFRVNNPNAASSCGCGSSFAV